MSVFTTHRFMIDKTNTNYVKALTKYGKHYYVSEINYKSMYDKNYTCHDLPEIIKTIRADEFGIECRSANSGSTVDTLPVLDRDKLITAITAPLTIEECSIAKENAETIGDYFASIIARGGRDIYIPTPDNIKNMTESQALMCLDFLQKKFEVTGAMFYPDINTILLQVNNENFVIKFGKESKFYQFPMMVFDLDDGYISNHNDGSSKENIIINRLQELFLAWKANNYEGDVIPANKSGFNYQSSLAASPVSAHRKLSQFASNSQAGRPEVTDNIEAMDNRPAL